MWRLSEAELNWWDVDFEYELMQLLTGMSIKRYLPANGTAGFRSLVNG